ncbi:serine--tRNA synthetase-like protein Slimp [Aethina tumida]|uniref:serine--tRNA synthetase-like protein Slimp n=1 Tax=Aethina tumida TaxID=116153 RepID=UPI0021484C02|nr:serine--tRNA synthetase-like protein Slimp [Aethina tumida]
MFHRQLLKVPAVCGFRSFSSALYITGDKADKHFAVLTPYVDFGKILENREKFVNNLKSRSVNIDLDKVVEKWEFFQDIDNKRKQLEATRSKIGNHISKLLKTDGNKEELEKWKLQSKLVKDDLKNLKDMYYNVEENVFLQILSLPNELHENTPINNEVLIHEKNKKPDNKTDSHINLSKSINYINPYNCYLTADCALFEISALNYLRKHLQKSKFTQFSSPDFSRSVVVEGAGKNFENAQSVLTIEEPHEKFNSLSRLHLTGGAALESFLAYFTKHLVDLNKFPLQYFSVGRKYQPFDDKWNGGLFNLAQDSALSMFMGYMDGEGDLLKNIQNVIIDFYDSLNYHYKLVIIPAKDLHFTESLRLSIQMYSNNLQRYIEVGNISLNGDYFSKRLLFTTTINKERAFPNVISGTLLNVQKFLGCAIENNHVDNKPLLCDLLRKYMFV